MSKRGKFFYLRPDLPEIWHEDGSWDLGILGKPLPWRPLCHHSKDGIVSFTNHGLIHKTPLIRIIIRKRPLITDKQWPWTGNGGFCLLLHSGEPLISTTVRHKFDLDPYLWPQPLTLTSRQCNSDVKMRIWAFDLDLWPTTLTFNPNLVKVKDNLHTKYQGRR